MVTECYAMARGSMLRVTRLNPQGGFADEDIQYVASKSVASVKISEINAGNSPNEVLKTEDQEPRLHFVNSNQTIRYGIEAQLIRVDPQMLSLMTGVPVVPNDSGDIVGFDSNTRIAAPAFALEIWSRLTQGQCEGDVGFGEGGFGMGPFGGGEGRKYGYTLFPFIKGGVMSGFTFSGGLVSFTITKASTRRGSKWNVGPHPDARLLTPVSRNTHWRTFVSTIAPPEQTDGIVTFSDTLEGGSASVTSSDVVDGEFVTTSPDIVEGGSAA